MGVLTSVKDNSQEQAPKKSSREKKSKKRCLKKPHKKMKRSRIQDFMRLKQKKIRTLASINDQRTSAQ